MDAYIVANYDVLKFIEHGGRCRPAMDYLPGELLIYRLKRCPEVEKALLFDWIKQLLYQLELFHRCRNHESYRYLNPYSVLVTQEEKLLLLDLEAESNEFVLRNLQKRAMRNHFVKPVVNIRENTKISLDLYGYAKTIQFILANVNVEPSLTKREENRLEKIIDKCLCENQKKQYEDLKQIKKELPSIQDRRWKIQKKWGIVSAVLAGLLIVFLVFLRNNQTEKEQQQLQDYAGNYGNLQSEQQVMIENAEEGGIQTTGFDGEGFPTDTKRGNVERMEEKSYVPDGMTEVSEGVDALQEYMLRNTSQDNWEIIEQGEELKRELLRYLAAAYDREDMKEKAKEAYEELCRVEVQEELLESAYLRRIALEMEQNQETAFQTGKEAMQNLPHSKSLAEKYLEILKGREGMTKEECKKELEALLEQFPALKDSKSCQELERAYGLTEGVKENEEKDMSAGN